MHTSCMYKKFRKYVMYFSEKNYVNIYIIVLQFICMLMGSLHTGRTRRGSCLLTVIPHTAPPSDTITQMGLGMPKHIINICVLFNRVSDNKIICGFHMGNGYNILS